MVNTRLIGLYSPVPQSGKSTVANILVTQGYRVIPFAGTLKRMTQLMLADLGQTPAEIRHSMGAGKEAPCVLLPEITPRQIMQRLGTDWGRKLIDAELWVRCWKGQAIRSLGDGLCVVADDVRFPNEASAVRDLGGLVIRVLRPGGGSTEHIAHASEGALDGWGFDHTLVNDGSIDDLAAKVQGLFATFSPLHRDACLDTPAH